MRYFVFGMGIIFMVAGFFLTPLVVRQTLFGLAFTFGGATCVVLAYRNK